jgi:hypothetical protein
MSRLHPSGDSTVEKESSNPAKNAGTDRVSFYRRFEGWEAETKRRVIMGSVESDELNHDQGTISDGLIQAYMEEAMDEAIDRLFSGKSIGRMFLSDYVEKFAEDVAASLIRKDFLGSEKLETLIRRELEDSEEVRELAIEFAGEE